MQNKATVICCANQKGGVGKTFTAENLGIGLVQEGKKVLLIDTDSQCNSTDTFGAKVENHATLFDLLFSESVRVDVRDCVQHTYICDIIASDDGLVQAELKFPQDWKAYVPIKLTFSKSSDCSSF